MEWKFKFSCGCTFPRKKCQRKWLNKYKSWHYICPKHSIEGIMIYRVATCEECLQDFKVQAKGQVPHFCKDCIIKKETKKGDKNVTLIPLSNPDIQANIDRSDCIHRVQECLLNPKYSLTYLPCRTCDRYYPKKDQPVKFAYNGGDWLDD